MAVAAISANPGNSLSYGVSVNVSRSTSQSTSATNSSTAVGSSVVGAGNVNIVATGGGKDSDILVSGSTVAAANNVNLSADDAITLQASKDTSVSVGQSRGSGESIGVTYGVGAQTGFSIQLGVSGSKGSDNQNDTRYNASQVSAGNAVNIQSGGDLTLNGAVVDAERIKADVGGNLTINTPQDVSVGNSRQSSSGLNVSLCIPPWCYGAVASVSGNVAGAKANGVTISPNTQSGLKAGDGGFDVNVKGDTTLNGGVIESTQAAIDKGRNSFETGGTLTIRDLQNVSQSSGSSYSANGSLSLGYTTKDDPNPTWDPKKGQSAAPPGGSAGVGSTSSSTQSVTRAGISGIAGDQSVRTGDNSTTGTLVKDWNTQNILKDVQAQAAIAQQFNQTAAKAIGDYAEAKYQSLKDTDPAEAAKWAEGGEYRVALHTAAGALSGGVAGALGAGASAALMPRLANAIDEMHLSLPVAQALAAVTATAIGGIAGGTTGATSAYNVELNNRQLHPSEKKWIDAHAEQFAAEQGISLDEAEKRLADQAFRQVQFGAPGDEDSAARQFLRTAGQQLLPGDPNAAGQNVGYMFAATPAQKANARMYLDAVMSSPEALKFYADNNINQPTIAQISQAASRDSQARAEIAALTIQAAAMAGGLALMPALSGVAAESAAFARDPVGYCSINPTACVATVELVVSTASGVPMVGPSVGKIVGDTSKLTAAELNYAAELAAGGRTVQVIPTAGARTADFFIDGVKVELKTMTSVQNQTSDGLSKALSSTIMDARGQSGNIVIDARSQIGMTPEIAERGIIRAFGNDNRTGAKIQGVTVITSQGIVYVPRIKE